MFILSIVPDYKENDIILLRNNINVYGIIFHFLSILGFCLGSHFAVSIYRDSNIKNKFFLFHRRRFNNLIYLYCLVGVSVVLWQISVSVSLKYYLNELIHSFFFQIAMPDIRIYFLRSREAGGLPGIIKMFSYLPLSALYMVLTYQIIKKKNDNHESKMITNTIKKFMPIIFITILVRSIFTLDRAVLFSFLLILLYYFTFISSNFKKFITILIRRPLFAVIVIIVSVFIYFETITRQGMDFLKMLAKYSSLGLANLSILFESEFDYTLGISVFSVIKFPLEYFGLTNILQNFKEGDWIWNPARYLTAYAYHDFGIFCIVFFLSFGFLSTFIYLKAWNKSNPYFIVVLFPLIIAIASSIVVPLFRGPEWWVGLMMGIIGIKLCFKVPKKSQKSVTI